MELLSCLSSAQWASPGGRLDYTLGKRRLSFLGVKKVKLAVSQRCIEKRIKLAVTQRCHQSDDVPSCGAKFKDLLKQPIRHPKSITTRESSVAHATTQESPTISENDGECDVTGQFSPEGSAKVLVIFGEGSISPFSGASWDEVLQQTARRINWIDRSLEMIALSDKQARSPEFKDKFELYVQESSILVAVNIYSKETMNWLKLYSGKIPTRIPFDSIPGLEICLGGTRLSSVGLIEELTSGLPGNKLTERRKVFELVSEAWERKSPDNIVFAILVLVDSFVTPVKLLKNLRATGLGSLKCMVAKCGQQILQCLLDPNCRKALNCLNSCAPTDQVCSYRCIVSYESPQLEQFTLCILQKNNCLGLSADILMQPDVQPMSSFRGQPLTHDLAEDLFVGWLDKLKWSWRVVAGQNAAYDQFPNQYQIFYRGKAKGSVWYDPVFQVRTLEGQTVWRRRHYRVKRSATPGNFYFSVLDNGVISNEFWRIVDVTDDLSWGLFYYSGAAAAAGQSYTGAVLVTPDGKWPDVSQQGRLTAALDKCGIKEWELYGVENTELNEEDAAEDGAPLGIPNDSKLHLVI